MFEKIGNLFKSAYNEKVRDPMIKEGYLVSEKTLERFMKKIHTRSVKNLFETYQGISLWYDNHYVDGEFLMSGSELQYFLDLLFPYLKEQDLINDQFLDFLDNLYLYADEAEEHDLYVETLQNTYNMCQQLEN